MKKMVKNSKKEKKISRNRNLREYWKFVSPYKRSFFVVLFLVAIMESVGFIDKWLFKVLIDGSVEFTNNSIALEVLLSLITSVIIAYILVHLFYMVLEWLEIHIRGELETKIQFDLKNRYFGHILDLDHEFHTTHKTGSLISRLVRAGGATERLNHVLIYMILPFFIQIIILSAVFVYFSLWQALIVFLFSTIYLTNAYIVSKKFEPWKEKENKKSDREKGILADIFTNIDSVRYFGKNKLIKGLFSKISDETRTADKKAWYYWRWADIPGNIIRTLGPILLLIIPIREFLSGNMTLGTVTFVYTAYLGFLGALRNFSQSIREFGKSMIDMEELFDYGEVNPKIIDKPNARPLQVKQGRVEFKGIDFSYDKRKLFKNFGLEVPQNKKVALVGHSGCGKTSLIKLLYRLYDVQKGQILVDGQDIRDVKQESLRSEMAIVPQECVLFDDTIYNNIKFSKPNATREEVLRAIKFAQLDKIIATFPNKEETIVGERGVKLSGGEKQRVSIARAILADKKILVLDEATSSLDSETEFEIQRDLARLMEGRTSIIIAHRLSTIMHADIIVVIQKGKIVQMGRHSKLISQTGEYKKLWNLQKGGYIGK